MTSLISISIATTSVSAQTVTVGKGAGILWRGFEFDITHTFKSESQRHPLNSGILGVSSWSSSLSCINKGIKMIAGYPAFSIGDGLGLVVEARGHASYTRVDGTHEILSGTIGFPETRGSSTSRSTIIPNSGDYWCLPASATDNPHFFKTNSSIVTTLSGSWLIVGDGTQKTGNYRLFPMLLSRASYASLNQDVQVFPSNVDIRVTTLDCTVNTPASINFGGATRNTQPGAELAVQSVPLITTCGQHSDYVNANINLQFRAISNLFDNTPSRLALDQGAGYITGEINNGVTGSGGCAGISGLRFDNSPIKVGNLTTKDISKTFTNQITWRLCSGGNNLPTGSVSAAAEMSVTFN
ncbi:hypothetical protein SAMN02744775_04276 [Enterobacter sp. CC120223-11]|nr:hypothetical protein SAMN02744775_04276 [Enterobacter sp. CC120223-11]